MHAARKRSHPKGMTLIEIMVVITLLGLIAAAVGVSAMGMLVEGERQTAASQAMELAAALDTYKVLHGKYPAVSDGLAALATPGPGGRAPVLDHVPLDPWKNAYELQQPGVHNPARFDVWSRGPDGVAGTGDEVGNWQQVAP